MLVAPSRTALLPQIEQADQRLIFTLGTTPDAPDSPSIAVDVKPSNTSTNGLESNAFLPSCGANGRVFRARFEAFTATQFYPKILDINIFLPQETRKSSKIGIPQNRVVRNALFQKNLINPGMASELQYSPPIGQPRLPPGAQVVTPEPGRCKFKEKTLKYLHRTLLLALLAFTTMQAQDVTKGNITGIVKDPSGTVIPGATVKLSSPYGDKTTTTDGGGVYNFLNLVIGPGYTVEVDQPGFAPAIGEGPDGRHQPAHRV